MMNKGRHAAAIPRWVSVGGLVFTLGLFAWWCAGHLDFFAYSIDEGMYVQRARMVRAGFGLYEEIWFNHPPMLVVLVRAAFDRVGESVPVARMVSVALATIGILAIAGLARSLAGRTAGLVAAWILISSPQFTGLARSVMSTLPALCLATAALWLAVVAIGKVRRWPWLLASSLSFGAGMTIKYIGAPMVIPIGLAILWPDDGNGRAPSIRGFFDPRRWGEGIVWAAVAAIPLALVFWRFGAAAMWSQTVGSLAGARSAFGLDWVTNVQDVLEWLSEGHAGIAILGAYGLARGPWRDARWWILLVWLASITAAVLLQTPLWSHHRVYFVLPLSVGAGAGLVWIAQDLLRAWLVRRRSYESDLGARSQPSPNGSIGGDPGWLSFGLVALVTFVFALPVSVHRIRDLRHDAGNEAWRTVAAVGELVAPDDRIVTDSPMLAFRAGARVPPNLTDPSAKRIESGALTLADVADEIVDGNARAVVFWNGRFAERSSDPMPSWLRDNGWRALLDVEDDELRQVLVPPIGAEPTDVPTLEASPEWSDGMRLEGFSLDGMPLRPGGTLIVTLYWRGTPPPAGDHTVYRHLMGPDGERVAQHDGPPARGMRPTDHWRDDELVIDRQELGLPHDLVPGETYRLRVGWYGSLDGQARLLQDAGSLRSDGQAILLGPIPAAAD